jgi:uncharacterized repeat protein (TIGR03803 family)
MNRSATTLLLAVALASCAQGAGSTGDSVPAALRSSARTQAKTGALLHVLHAFKGGSDGFLPAGSLAFWNDTLWGTTMAGGASSTSAGNGVIFAYDLKTRSEHVAYRFKGGADGSDPFGGLTLLNGVLYGTTAGSGRATIFSFDPATGTERVLHRFEKSEDSRLTSGLTAVNGILYGAAATGGIATKAQSHGGGTLFSFDPVSGGFRVLHAFAGAPDGQYPEAAPIAVNGVLYGTTSSGGDPSYCAGCGTVYSYDLASGQERIVSTFGGDIDGENPDAELTFARGRLYGTTPSGGYGDCEYDGPCGTVFSVLPSSGLERVVYRFGSVPDGSNPAAAVIVSGGNLYGTTQIGGVDDVGSIFSIDMTTRRETTLFSFPRTSSQTAPYPLGRNPSSPLLLVNGTYYGTAEIGGPIVGDNQGDGTLFAFQP